MQHIIYILCEVLLLLLFLVKKICARNWRDGASTSIEVDTKLKAENSQKSEKKNLKPKLKYSNFKQ